MNIDTFYGEYASGYGTRRDLPTVAFPATCIRQHQHHHSASAYAGKRTTLCSPPHIYHLVANEDDDSTAVIVP